MKFCLLHFASAMIVMHLTTAYGADGKVRSRPSCSVIRSATPSQTIRRSGLFVCGFSSNSSMYLLDPDTGRLQEIGRTGYEVTDMAVSGNRLYGISFEQFFEIDAATGRASSVRSHGLSGLNALVAIPGDSDGFYAASWIAEDSECGAAFARIDRRTGRATIVGYLGTGLSSAGDLVFHNGQLYAALKYRGSDTTFWAVVDPVTGKAQILADTGIRDLWALEIRDGRMFGATGHGSIVEIEHTTGSCRILSSAGIVAAGMASVQ
ncbi:MAG: hypothetical protein RL215_3064 [Planctomycetota bacterium]